MKRITFTIDLLNNDLAGKTFYAKSNIRTDSKNMVNHQPRCEYSVLIDIEEAVVLKGLFPNWQLKLVRAWCELYREELVRNWKSAETSGTIAPIEPLH